MVDDWRRRAKDSGSLSFWQRTRNGVRRAWEKIRSVGTHHSASVNKLTLRLMRSTKSFVRSSWEKMVQYIRAKQLGRRFKTQMRLFWRRIRHYQLWRRMKIWMRLFWRRLKRSDRMGPIVGNTWNLVKALISIVLLAGLVYWINQKASSVAIQFPTIPTVFWWVIWGIGSASVISLLAWLFYKSQLARTFAMAAISWWFWWRVVTTVLLVLVIFTAATAGIGLFKVLYLGAAWDPPLWPKWPATLASVQTTPPLSLAVKPAFDPTGTFEMVLKPKQKFRLVVPQMHRWDFVGETPYMGWRTDNGDKDMHGNRIQIFELVPSEADEVTLAVRISKCATQQGCLW